MARVLLARIVGSLCVLLPLVALSWSRSASAHPMVENVLDVEIAPDHIIVTARASMEEVLLAEAAGGAGISAEMRMEAARSHGAYVLRHLHLRADDRPLTGKLLESIPPSGAG